MIVVEGLEAARAYLNFVSVKVAGSWSPVFRPLMEKLRRFAASISPVVTGSYQGSHRIAVGDKEASLSIDPSARNTTTGTLVSRYAGFVELRHGVYSRTGDELTRLAAGTLEDVMKELKL